MTSPSDKVVDSNFNDDELADIMAEIEGLEKEALANGDEGEAISIDKDTSTNPESEKEESKLEGEMAELSNLNAEEKESSVAPKKESLQETIDREMEAVKAEVETQKNVESESEKEKNKILNFPSRDPAPAAESVVTPQSLVSDSNGPFQLNCNMSEFKINFQVDGQNFCLEVGPQLGVCLTLADGAKLSVPWKKKVA